MHFLDVCLRPPEVGRSRRARFCEVSTKTYHLFLCACEFHLLVDRLLLGNELLSVLFREAIVPAFVDRTVVHGHGDRLACVGLLLLLLLQFGVIDHFLAGFRFSQAIESRKGPDARERGEILLGVASHVITRMQESVVDQLKEDGEPEADADERHQRVFQRDVRLRRVDRVDDRERDVFDVVDRVEADVM